MKKPIMLIIGRFQPFHLGHLKIIKKYSNKGYHIKVGIGSSENPNTFDNPFNAKERKEMITLSLNENKIKDFEIFFIPDINNDDIYESHVKNIVGEFDVIFTGNPWTLKLFLNFKINNYKIHSFDEKTERIGNISATKIRENWLNNPSPKNLPKPVFLYLKKINAQKRLKELKGKG